MSSPGSYVSRAGQTVPLGDNRALDHFSCFETICLLILLFLYLCYIAKSLLFKLPPLRNKDVVDYVNHAVFGHDIDHEDVGVIHLYPAVDGDINRTTVDHGGLGQIYHVG